MPKIVLVSFTPLDASGGVPRWNRDFVKCFGYNNEIEHFSWTDVAADAPGSLYEWEKAKVLASYLHYTKKVSVDDIVIGDGFWVDGYHGPKTISVCHGIWGHLIKEEADAGKEPDFPFYHAAQIDFRKRFTRSGGRLVAVSEFIQYQMKEQWGFVSHIINNAIDTRQFQPAKDKLGLVKPLIIHGVNDRTNGNKGWGFVEETKRRVDAHIMSLDEAHTSFGDTRDKYHTLALADVVIIPSAYEGNSYFALEAMACGVPVVAYDVGLFWELSPYNPRNKTEGFARSAGIGNLFSQSVGVILNRKDRDKSHFATAVSNFVDSKAYVGVNPRGVIEAYNIDEFKYRWQNYIMREFGHSLI